MTERDSLTYAQPAGEPYAGVSETLSAVVFSVAVHHPRLSGYRRRGAAGANCLLAMVTTSRRVRSEPPARGLAHRQLFRRPGRWQEGRRSCCWSCCYPPPLDVVGVCLSLLAGQQLRPAWIPWFG